MWIARDIGNTLWMFTKKPSRIERYGTWDDGLPNNFRLELDSYSFPQFKDLKWEDEPIEVNIQPIDNIPTYCLLDILNQLPQSIKCDDDVIGKTFLYMNPMRDGGWNIGYEYSTDGHNIKFLSVFGGDILDAAYDMLVWYKKNYKE